MVDCCSLFVVRCCSFVVRRCVLFIVLLFLVFYLLCLFACCRFLFQVRVPCFLLVARYWLLVVCNSLFVVLRSSLFVLFYLFCVLCCSFFVFVVVIW